MIRRKYLKQIRTIGIVGVISASLLTFGLLGYGGANTTNILYFDDGRVKCECEYEYQYQCKCEEDCDYKCSEIIIHDSEENTYIGGESTFEEDLAEGNDYEDHDNPYDQGSGDLSEGDNGNLEDKDGDNQNSTQPGDEGIEDGTDPYEPYDPQEPPVEPGPGEEIPGINIPVIPEPPVIPGPGEEIPGVNVPVPPTTPEEEVRPPGTMPAFDFTPPVVPQTFFNPIITRPRGSITPSGEFVDLENRVRFSLDAGIEELPPFITMEMVVGVLLAQDRYDFPASVAIAQIIQEGGYGRYGPGGEYGLGLSRLSFYYHNLFGIKGTGTAGSVNMRTFEMTPDGVSYNINDNFRVYNTFTESILDRSQLLHQVYSDLTEGVTDANTFAWNIGSRWATDVNYARSLIRHMVNYDLYRLDEMTLQDYNSLLGEGRFIHPVPGSVVTSPFGWRAWDNAFHRGIDFGTGIHNLPVYAAESGHVVFVGYSLCAGNWIVIDHGDGLYTRYMHNLANFVEEGQEIFQGQQIALTGTTGNSTGNHLHFEVILNGRAINPALMLGMLF
jgi:murein DD-endopeptidase MepM/ murein hydrolase activator NlpD